MKLKYFNSIYDLPVTRYHKVIEESSLKYLLKDTEDKETEELYKAWEDINVQLIDEFGISNDMEIMFHKQNTINKIKLQMIMGDRSNETLCRILESEVGLIKSRQQDVKDIRKYHARLYRILDERYKRDSHNLSTFEFYNDLNDLQDEQRRKEVKDLVKKRKYA